MTAPRTEAEEVRREATIHVGVHEALAEPHALRRRPGSAFIWDEGLARYRSARTGRFVSRADVTAAFNRALRSAREEMRTASLGLQAGELTIAEWQVIMAERIKDTHLFSTAIARGGWGQMTPADFGRVGGAVRQQYRYLQRFAIAIEEGLPLDGRFLTRAGMYLDASRTVRHKTERLVLLETTEMTEERNVLGVAEHCDGCLDATAEGWVPIGTLPAIGTRACLSHCQCHIEYR